MSKQKTDKQVKSSEEIREEIKRLSQRADESSGQPMDLFGIGAELGNEDIDLVFDASIINDTANPDESYKFFYGINSLLRKNLPQGEQNKTLRQFIYDEKNLFLNRGIQKGKNGTRGSDARMTYIPNFLEDAFNIIAKWISSGGSSFDLYMEFWNVNEQRGYHKKAETKTNSDTTLEGLMQTPPPIKANKKRGQRKDDSGE